MLQDYRPRLPCLRYASLLLFPLFLLLGCGPRVGGGEMAAQRTASPLVVDLPALYIDYDRDGTARVGTVAATAVGAALGVDLGRLDLNRATLDVLMAWNIQHIQLSTVPGQLHLLVNGYAMPAPRWDAEQLSNARQIIREIGTDPIASEGAALVEKLTLLAPAVAEWGGGIVLRFPVTPGTTVIPLSARQSTALPSEAQATYLDLIGAPPQLIVDVFYRSNGAWTVDGLDATAWAAILPLPWQALNLEAETVATLRRSGIRELRLATNQRGLFVTINAEPLPHLAWAEGELDNMVAAIAESGRLPQLLDEVETATSLVRTVRQLLPMLQATDVQLRVYFASAD